MAHSLRKLIRTFQSELPFLKEAKDAFYFHGRRLMGRPHEREFNALALIPDGLPGTYVDVGANHGQSIESIKVVKPNARIHSFEANPLLAEKLRKRYEGRSDITVYPYGLSDQAMSQPLFVPVYKGFVYDGDASMDRTQAAALYNPYFYYAYNPKRLVLREVPCAVQRMDDQKLEPLFIKMDVQGYELQVVKGGLETIRRHEPILMIECVHDQPELSRLLTSLGYDEYLFDQYGFFPGRSSGSLNQILMTRRRARDVRGDTAPVAARAPGGGDLEEAQRSAE
jgi:FkbM family methyltransferase